jgi:hypothetical protein
LTKVAPNLYFPALKGKAGELQTLKNAPALARQAMIPILDLPIDEDSDHAEVESANLKLASGLCQSYDATNLVIIDATVTDGVKINGKESIEDLHARLRSDVAAVPALSVTSSPDFLSAVAAISSEDGNGACIRLSDTDFSDTGILALNLASTVSALNLPYGSVDLVLDLGHVDASSATAYAGFIPLLISNLPNVQDWRSLVVLSGAFPQGLSDLKAYEPRRFTRHDADLWGRIVAASPVRLPSFGDYATSHPATGATVGFRSAPNIRYTTGDEWYAVKTGLDRVLGNKTFFKIAEQLRGETPPIMEPATFSWGDGELRRCADSTGGPGGGKEWKAWSTSHHLAAVISNLATTGAP